MILKRKICVLVIICGALLIGTYMIFTPKYNQIDFSGIGTEYSLTNSEYNESRIVNFQGKYKKSAISSDEFTGKIFIEGIQGLKREDTVSVSFSGMIGTPDFQSETGMKHISQIHSIVLDSQFQYAIICLYSQFNDSNGTVRGIFNLDSANFICVGKITRDRAIELLSDIYGS